MSSSLVATGVQFPDSTTQTTAATGFGFKNRIINGAMYVAQRGTIYALTNALAYGSLDRFFAAQNGTANGRFAQLAYNANSFQNIALLGRNGSATTTGVIYTGQVIESNNIADLAGNSVTLSFYAYAGANFSAASNLISVYVISGTTADQGAASMVAGTWAGTSSIVNTTQAITTTLTRYTFTATVPSGCKELGFYIAYTPTGTAGADDNIYFTGVQLEKGTVATSFDYRPYGTELALCQRYFQVPLNMATRLVTGFFWSNNNAFAQGFLKVSMRAAPTVTFSGTFYGIDASGTGRGMTPGTESTTTEHINYAFSNGFNQVAGNATVLGMSSSGYVWASAEL